MCVTCSHVNCLAWSHAYVLTCLCLHALCAYVLCAYMLMCLVCLHAYVPCMLTCQCVLYVYVLTCQHLFMLCMSTSSHAITTNDKDKFSITCFRTFLWLFFVFFLRNKNCCTFLHFSYQSEAFNGCYDKLCTMKWFDFCLSITLRVIFKWLIKVERWIIMYRS